MKHLLFRQLLIGLSLAVGSAAGCAPAAPSQPEGWVCLGSFTDYAYRPVESPHLSRGAHLATPWELTATVPITLTRFGSIVAAVRRADDGGDEVWVRIESGDLSSKEPPRFWVYNTATQTWRDYAARLYRQTRVRELFVSVDGSLWGTSVSVQPSLARPYYFGIDSFLSRFDEAAGEFRYVMEAADIPAGPRTDGAGSIDNLVQMDPTGVIWVMVPQDGLYAFDTTSLTLTQSVHLPELSASYLTLDGQERAFVQRPSELGVIGLNQGELAEIDLTTGRMTDLEVPVDRWPGAGSLLFDSSSRLWYSAVGYLSQEDGWTLIHPDPLGFFWEVEYNFNLRATLPQVYRQTRDGRLWFTHGLKGAAWFDPDENEGCWFSTGSTPVHEGDDGTLWASVGTSLYAIPSETP